MTSLKEGRTVLFVSHNMGAITRLCTRVCWMDERASRPGWHPWRRGSEVPLFSGVGQTPPGLRQERERTGKRQEMSLLAARILDAIRRSRPLPSDSINPSASTCHIASTTRFENAAVVASFMDLAGNLIFESWDTDAEPNGHARSLARDVSVHRASSQRHS